MKKKYLVAWLAGTFVLIYAVMSIFGWRFTPALSIMAPNLGDAFHLHSESGIWTLFPYREYPQLSLKKMSVDQATKEYLKLSKSDSTYDWKVALSFYGKVIDESGNPVLGADVAFDWNTVGVPGGTAGALSTSDAAGLFSLTGQHGKVLGVAVRKEGYYQADRPRLTRSFEYASPWEPDWYEPDSKNPVVFHLRKKGEGARLFSKRLDIPLSTNHPLERVNLIQGFIKPDGVLTISCDTSKMLPGAFPYPWSVTLSMAEGGIVETTEQFPFLAPTSGYVPTVVINEDSSDPGIWRGEIKRIYYFYLPSSNTYGRFTMDKVASLSLVSLDFAYNQTPGEGVLEPAPKSP